VGPTREVEDVFGSLEPVFREAEVDFVVLLGDNIDDVSDGGLAELERALIQLETPTVVVAGPREVGPSSGAEFLRLFGPHDHVWRLKGVRFFAFYSALATLGPRGLSRLEGFLGQLSDSGDAETPLIGVTHVPPFDPNDLRDNSFRNEIEAAQLLSVLEDYGVHQLYTGGLGVGYERIHGVETFVTTARGTVTQPQKEWMLVEVLPSGEGREIAEQVVVSRRIEL